MSFVSKYKALMCFILLRMWMMRLILFVGMMMSVGIVYGFATPQIIARHCIVKEG
jgi:hypothetical protein